MSDEAVIGRLKASKARMEAAERESEWQAERESELRRQDVKALGRRWCREFADYESLVKADKFDLRDFRYYPGQTVRDRQRQFLNVVTPDDPAQGFGEFCEFVERASDGFSFDFLMDFFAGAKEAYSEVKMKL